MKDGSFGGLVGLWLSFESGIQKSLWEMVQTHQSCHYQFKLTGKLVVAIRVTKAVNGCPKYLCVIRTLEITTLIRRDTVSIIGGHLYQVLILCFLLYPIACVFINTKSCWSAPSLQVFGVQYLSEILGSGIGDDLQCN